MTKKCEKFLILKSNQLFCSRAELLYYMHLCLLWLCLLWPFQTLILKTSNSFWWYFASNMNYATDVESDFSTQYCSLQILVLLPVRISGRSNIPIIDFFYLEFYNENMLLNILVTIWNSSSLRKRSYCLPGNSFNCKGKRCIVLPKLLHHPHVQIFSIIITSKFGSSKQYFENQIVSTGSAIRSFKTRNTLFNWWINSANTMRDFNSILSVLKTRDFNLSQGKLTLKNERTFRNFTLLKWCILQQQH